MVPTLQLMQKGRLDSMINVFGNNWQEAKDPRHIRSVLGADAFDKLIREADGLDRKDPQFAEQLADLVVKAWEMRFLALDFMADLRIDADMHKTFLFDLKTYVIMAFYYEQLINKPKFANHTEYTQAFDNSFTYKPKHQEIVRKLAKYDAPSADGAKPQRRFLPGFFSESPRPRVYHTLIDIGLVMALIASSDPKKNPYVPSNKKYRFRPYDFLQSFETAFLKKERVNELLHYWKSAGTTADKRMLESEIILADSISKEGYAVINQFCIERFTNMNFLISYFNLLNADPRNNLSQPDQCNGLMFNKWLHVPLFKTRLKILHKYKIGQLSPNNIYERIPELLADTAIPFVYGTYYHIMSRAEASVRRDEPFFKMIYGDPDAGSYTDSQYVLFQYNEGKELCPVERFCISGKTELSNILFELIKEEGVFFKNNIKKSAPFPENRRTLLTVYENEIKYSGRAKEIEEKAGICTEIHNKLLATRIEFGNVIKSAYLSSFQKESDRLRAEIDNFAEQYKNAAHEVRECMSDDAVFILDIFQIFGIPYIPGTSTQENPYAVPCYEIDFASLQKYRYFVSEFGEFYKFMTRLFDGETAGRTEMDFHNVFQPMVDRLNAFDDIVRKIETLREFAVLNPDIVKGLENVYNYYAPKKE